MDSSDAGSYADANDNSPRSPILSSDLGAVKEDAELVGSQKSLGEGFQDASQQSPSYSLSPETKERLKLNLPMNLISERSEIDGNSPDKNQKTDAQKKLEALIKSAKKGQETPRYKCHNDACQIMHTHRNSVDVKNRHVCKSHAETSIYPTTFKASSPPKPKAFRLSDLPVYSTRLNKRDVNRFEDLVPILEMEGRRVVT